MNEGKMKILVIDDNQDLVTTLEILLTESFPGSKIFTSQKGSEGIKIAQEEYPDVILLDIAMPEMDGFEVCQKLKSDERTRHIPIVFQTASKIDRENRIKALEAGAEGFLYKPIDEQELIVQIQTMAKIKAANVSQINEKKRLAELVDQQTSKLKNNYTATLNLLEDLHKENENRKKSEAALRISEERFRRISTTMSDVLYSCKTNKDGIYEIDWMTGGVERITGYSIGEVNAMRCWGKLVVEEDLHIFENSVVKLIPGSFGSCELRLRHKKGGIVWIASYAECTKEEGNPGCQILYGGLIGITERKEAEEKIRKSEEKYRSIFENVQDVYYEALIDGTILEISPSIEIMTKGQYKREDLIGKSMYDFYNDAGQRRTLLAQLEKHGAVSDFEIVFKNRDGSLSTCSIISKIYRNENGKPENIIGSMRDITERKQTVERAKQFYHIVEESLNEIYIFDAGTLKFMQVNQAALHNIGYTLDEIQKLTPLDIKPDYNYESFMQILEPLRSGTKKDIAFQTRHLRKDKSFYPVEVHLQSSEYESRKVFVSFILDITEKQKLQNQLIQTQKVQSIGTLAGGIAHDFNNILGIILAFTSLLERCDGDKEKMRKSVTAITQAVNRGSSLTRQILTFARQSSMSIGTISIPELIREILAMLKETFPPIIEFRMDIEKDLPFINADNSQMHQVLLNLFVNSRDAMPKGGIISIKVRAVPLVSIIQKFPEATSDRYVSISISDTGKGMDEEIKSRIFDPFFTTKEQGKGTGLGLSVVFGIIQSHHGFISFESEVGKGTTFNLYLPAPQESNKNEELIKAASGKIIGGSETILFVEDEDLLRDIVKSTLETNGYKVIIAADGREAVEIYRNQYKNIALVITDMGLPKLTGIDEYTLMREINPLVKAIFASGFIALETRSELLKEGVKGFIQKPYVIDEVLRMARDVLDE